MSIGFETSSFPLAYLMLTPAPMVELFNLKNMVFQQVEHVDISLLPIQRAIEQYAKDTQNRSRLNKPKIDGQPTGCLGL